MKDEKRAIACIDMKNLAYNIKKIKKYINKPIMAVVKANAYGHGIYNASKCFIENGASMLGVACISEAVHLREKGIDKPILVLGDTHIDSLEYISKYDITQTIFCKKTAEKLNEIAKKNEKTINIHIKINTGMNRIGFLPNDSSLEDIMYINSLKFINIEGIFTHFLASDEKDKTYTKIQYKRYIDFIKKLEQNGIKNMIKHVSNSAAILDLKQYSLDMVRAGIILYGIYPSDEVGKNIHIKKAMELKSYVSFIKNIKKGEYVGYAKKYIANKDEKIATIPIGYADGYSRALSNKARVLINGEYANICGNICMDQMMADVSHIKNIKIGDTVTLIGRDGKNTLDIEEIARLQNTIPYEVVCNIGIGKRVEKIYKNI